jgi:hypothetical protein
MHTPWYKRVGSGRRTADKKTLAPVGVNRARAWAVLPGVKRAVPPFISRQRVKPSRSLGVEESGFAAGWYIDPNGGVKPEFDNRCINNC